MLTVAAEHKARVWLSYTEHGTPYKWRGACSCGYNVASWAWSRPYYAANDPAWVGEGNSVEGGALPMILEHVGL
jgi:hypothetical protein